MIALFLVALTAGLVLGVFAMLYGTERRHAAAMAASLDDRHDPAREPSPWFNQASIAAGAFGFGLTGYLLARFGHQSMAMATIIGAAVGALLMAVQALLFARWAIPSARAETMDATYLLQGTPGRIQQAVPAGGVGSVQYAANGASTEQPARSLTDAAIPAGADVVIDRIEDGIAVVEPWADVEQRL